MVNFESPDAIGLWALVYFLLQGRTVDRIFGISFSLYFFSTCASEKKQQSTVAEWVTVNMTTSFPP